MCYLSPHSENKECQPIEKQYWPENRYIKCAEECHQKSNAKGLCDRVPFKEENRKFSTDIQVLKVCYSELKFPTYQRNNVMQDNNGK